MSDPGDRKYRQTHEWIKVDGETAVVGITNHAQSQLGDITYVGLPVVGATFNVGDELGSVESVKAVSDIYAPASGMVTEVNAALADAPELVNQSPYDKGWMVKMALTSDPVDVLNADEYDQFCQSESH